MKNNSQRIIASIFVVILIMSAISVSALLAVNVENQIFANNSDIKCSTQGDILPSKMIQKTDSDIRSDRKSQNFVCSLGDITPKGFDKKKDQDSSGS